MSRPDGRVPRSDAEVQPPAFLLIALAVVIVVISVLRLMSSDDSTSHQPPQALAKARELLVAVDNAELCHWQRHGRYGNLPDLDETMEALSPSSPRRGVGELGV